MRLTGMTLGNSKPRYLEEIFISIGCLRYLGSLYSNNSYRTTLPNSSSKDKVSEKSLYIF